VAAAEQSNSICYDKQFVMYR